MPVRCSVLLSEARDLYRAAMSQIIHRMSIKKTPILIMQAYQPKPQQSFPNRRFIEQTKCILFLTSPFC